MRIVALGPGWGSMLWGLVVALAAFVVYWKFVLVAAAMMFVAWVLVMCGYSLFLAEQRRREARAGLARRARLQHAAVLQGSPYGVYGEYPPADVGE